MQKPVDYRKSPSLSDISPSWGAEVTPYVLAGVVARPLEHAKTFVLDGADTSVLIAHLIDTNQREQVERTLQGICQTDNGEKLLSAFVSPQQCRQIARDIDRADLNAQLAAWIEHGCNEVVLDFLDGRSRAA